MAQPEVRGQARVPELAIVAFVLFLTAAVLVIFGGIDRKYIEALTLGGFACLAAAHVP